MILQILTVSPYVVPVNDQVVRVVVGIKAVLHVICQQTIRQNRQTLTHRGEKWQLHEAMHHMHHMHHIALVFRDLCPCDNTREDHQKKQTERS